jgi:hypothetical protein
MTLTFDRPGQLERATADWVRDEGRPLIKPDPQWQAWIDGGRVGYRNEPPASWLDRDGKLLEQRPYTRVTTFGEALLDGSMLSRWKMRRVVLGMGRRPDYVVAAAALTAEDRDTAALNDLAEKALEAAGPNAADIGTALHGFSERIDRGEPIGFVPPEYRADLERYREVVEAHLTWVRREGRMVCDALEVAGTPDGEAYCDQPDPDGVVDLLRIVDLKTGNIETTAGKFSCQLGIYANSARYNPETGERIWPENMCKRWGLVLHMPAGAGTAELRWLNLEHGFLGAYLAGPVRKWRTVNHADLMRPLIPVERTVAEGMCRGVKRDGDPCRYKAKADGLCTRHQGQDPDAVVPVRVQEVDAELRRAIDNMPEPLRIAQEETPLITREGFVADVESSTPVDESVDEESWGKGSPLTDEDLPPEMREPGELTPEQSALHDALSSAFPEGEASSADVERFTEEWLAARRQPVELNGNPTPHTSMPDPESAREAAEHAEQALMDQVAACRTAGELEMLYQATGQAWTASVKKYASRHRQLLPELARRERVDAALLGAIAGCRSIPELQALGRSYPVENWTDEAKDAARAAATKLPPF